jgi:ABC-type sugar transport system ATPase subunit
MREIPRVGDRITVLRDGQKVATLAVGEADDNHLIQLMTGRTLESLYPRATSAPSEVRLRLDRVSGRFLHEVSLEARAGEVVGIAGLVGSGKSEIGRVCFGVEPHTGTIELDGQAVENREGPRQILGRGLFYYPADRRGEGLVLPRPVRENLTFAALDRPDFSHGGMLRRGAERRRAADIITRLRIHPAQPERRVAYFSGGNQQKIVLGKWLAREPNILLLDEPTRGVDVGAKAEIFALVDRLRSEGAAILMVSSDLLEVIGASDRILVLHEGRLEGELPARGATQEAIMAFATRTHEGAA